MNFKTTGLLLVLLVVVGALIWLFGPAEKELILDEPPAPRPTGQLTDLLDDPPADETLARVVVERTGEPRMVFEKTVSSDPETPPADGWQIKEPVSGPADGHKVLGLARTLATLEYREKVAAGSGGVTADDAGLSPPVAVVTLATRDGRELRFEVGKKVVMSSDTYVRLGADSAIYVAARELKPQVQRGVDEYRAQRLIQARSGDIVAVAIDHAGRHYDFDRSDADTWVINEPVKAYADASKVRSNLLTPLTVLRAEEFVDVTEELLPRYGLAEPFLRLTVTTERTVPKPEAETQKAEPAEEEGPVAEEQTETITRTEQLLVGSHADLKSEKRYVKVGEAPWVAVVRTEEVDKLVPELDKLRDARIARFKPEDVTALALEGAVRRVALTREHGVWEGSAGLTDVEVDAVQELLATLSGLTAVSYIDQPGEPAEYGLDQPRVTWTAQVAGQVEPVTIRVGGTTPSERNAYVQRVGDATVYVVSAAQADALVVDPISLYARQIFRFPAENLTRLQVERGAMCYTLTRSADGEWQMVEPEGAAVSTGAARAIVTDLARLRAEDVVARDEFAHHGLDQPDLTVRFELTGSEATTQPAPTQAEAHMLRVGRADGVTYARRDDDPIVYRLDESVHESMTKELIAPRLFTFEAEDVSVLDLVALGGELRFAREADRWVYAPDPTLQLNQEAVDRLAQTVAGLAVDEYRTYQDGDLASVGLGADAPARVRVRLSDGIEHELRLRNDEPGGPPVRGALAGPGRIFRLKVADADLMMRGLDAYLPTNESTEQ